MTTANRNMDRNKNRKSLMSIVWIRWLGNAQSYCATTSKHLFNVNYLRRVRIFGSLTLTHSHPNTRLRPLLHSVTLIQSAHRQPFSFRSIYFLTRNEQRRTEFCVWVRLARMRDTHFRFSQGILKSDFIWDEIDSNGKYNRPNCVGMLALEWWRWAMVRWRDGEMVRWCTEVNCCY